MRLLMVAGVIGIAICGARLEGTKLLGFDPAASVEQHLELARSEMEKQHWSEAKLQLQPLLDLELASPLHQELLYRYAGCCYQLRDYEKANELLSRYLSEYGRDGRFEALIELKFAIAQRWAQGERRPLFGWPFMPRWLSAKGLAVELYDEVVMSRTPLASHALLAKAKLLSEQRHFHQSNRALQQLISEFATQPIVLEGFEQLARNYLLEMSSSSRSEELIEQARLNCQRMAQRFPSADLTQIERHLEAMRELYAESLLEAAQLYLRKGKREAYLLYLKYLTEGYPYSGAAQRAVKILQKEQS